MDELLACVGLVPENMRRNLVSAGQSIAAESAMMALAPVIGRTQAYQAVKKAIAAASQRRIALLEVLLEDDSVRGAIGRDALDKALDPAAYTGQSAAMARDMAAAARVAAASLAARGVAR
jgi:3-carboxy-cis,cis-muconate cycloisomerase